MSGRRLTETATRPVSEEERGEERRLKCFGVVCLFGCRVWFVGRGCETGVVRIVGPRLRKKRDMQERKEDEDVDIVSLKSTDESCNAMEQLELSKHSQKELS